MAASRRGKATTGGKSAQSQRGNKGARTAAMSSVQEIDAELSRELQARAKSIGVYDHPTGKGDGREDLIREVVDLRAGTSFGVRKGIIYDSHGHRSSEIDAVVFDQTSAASIRTVGERHMLRAEPVAVTIEVKSILDHRAWTDHRRAAEQVATLRRSYQPTMSFILLKRQARVVSGPDYHGACAAMMTDLRGDQELDLAVDRIRNVLFAYSAPDYGANHADLVDKLDASPNLDVLCVLGRFCVIRTSKPQANGLHWGLLGEGDAALGRFLTWIESRLWLQRLHQASALPNTEHYYTTKAL